MNITLELQELDDLIVKHTKPPVTAMLRNKLHPLREQMEAYIGTQSQKAEEHARLIEEHQKRQPVPPTTADPSEHRRGLYYRTGDVTPFCPQCREAANKNIRLFGPVPMADAQIERWTCNACATDYTAKPAKNFLPSPNRRLRSRAK